ncbi:MAG: TonB-dependent receptor plug domain-containing protein [Alphaproteobacteria bacterium]
MSLAVQCIGMALAAVLTVLAMPSFVSAQEADKDLPEVQSDFTTVIAGAGGPACDDDPCIIRYPAAFFDLYRPVTALDMVRNVPGFQIDNGDSSRGFAGAAGNVLIDGERPAVKSDSATAILSRLPASAVKAIDLIRGKAAQFDLRGQTVAVNVVLKPGAATATSWEAGLTFDVRDPNLYPFGEISRSGRKGKLRYQVGTEVERFFFRSAGLERVLDGAGVETESRQEAFFETGVSARFSGNGVLPLGSTVMRMNGTLDFFSDQGGETSVRTPFDGATAPFVLFQGDRDKELSAELGGDIERRLSKTVSAKLIGLYRRIDFEELGSLASAPVGAPTVVETETGFDTLETETILRIEIDYAGFETHQIELSAEGALNTLDSNFSLNADAGDGLGLQPVAVPGARTAVEELRGDFALSDSFSLGPISVDAILAAETSTIEQTGGFELTRSFFFVKPSLTMTWSPSEKTQLRLFGAREVGQLDFFDFVSSADLGDVELSLGNPDLAPELTWAIEAAVEQRFGQIGAFTFTAFYDWISDVSDLLPLGGVLEVPGNIGDGWRRGIQVEATLPLDRIFLRNGRFDITGRYQDSEVTDPVTGLERPLSGEREWSVQLDFRQDLTRQRWAWGWDLDLFAREPFFGLDELDLQRRTGDLDAFIETTRFWGMRMRLGANNLFNQGRDRSRAVFAGARGNAPVAFSEIRDRDWGRSVFLAFSGTF